MESDKKDIAIKDACILFDLVDLNLLEDFFQLELIVFTTPQVIGEITNNAQLGEINKQINKGKLVIDSNGDFNEIFNIYNEFPGLSVADSSVLELAKRRNAIVFSSDGSLRKISTRQNLVVRGILWIIEEMCNKNLITVVEALEKIEGYISINQRPAPKLEIEKLINRLKGKLINNN